MLSVDSEKDPGAQPRLIDLSGSPEIGRQVAGADQQHIDPVDRGGRLATRSWRRG
jgi:hypothetical protein